MLSNNPSENTPLATKVLLDHLEWTERCFELLGEYFGEVKPGSPEENLATMCSVAKESIGKYRKIAQECVIVPLTDCLK